MKVFVDAYSFELRKEVILKPGEYERLRKEQAVKFLKEVINKTYRIKPIHIRYLLRLYHIDPEVIIHLFDIEIYNILFEERELKEDKGIKICEYILKIIEKSSYIKEP